MSEEKRTFSLSADEIAFIDAQVATGAYPSADEVVREALRELEVRDADRERWLNGPELERLIREEVVPVYDELKAHPERAVSSEEWFENVLKLHAARRKAAE